MQHDDKEGRGSYDPPFEAHYKIKFNCDDCSGFAAAVETSISTSAPFIRSPTDYKKKTIDILLAALRLCDAFRRVNPFRAPLLETNSHSCGMWLVVLTSVLSCTCFVCMECVSLLIDVRTTEGNEQIPICRHGVQTKDNILINN